jgi:hypothetical protein
MNCRVCGGRFIYGAPDFCNENGVDIPYDRDCVEQYSAMLWPEDEWGSYPFTVFQRVRPVFRCDA